LLAQTPTPSSAPAQPDTVIHAGTLLDRPGKEPRRNASILIAKGKIVSVQDGFAKPSEGVTVIDLKDRFVLPGLIDCHVHLSSDRAGVEGQLAGVTDSAARPSYAGDWRRALLAPPRRPPPPFLRSRLERSQDARRRFYHRPQPRRTRWRDPRL